MIIFLLKQSLTKFIEELNETLEKFNNKKKVENKKMDDIKLTQEEDLEFYRKESKFLHEYFKKLLDLSNGEIFIVTDKYENDYKLHRYKVAQYKDNYEFKYIAYEKDLPENVKIGDVVRKVDGKYIMDVQATKYVTDTINRFKQEIIDNRNNN